MPQLDGTAAEPHRDAVLVEEDELFGVVDEPVPAILAAADAFQRDLGVSGSRLRMRTVVTDDARLTWYREGGRSELYHTSEDPDQMVNLWDSRSAATLRRDVMERLAATMADHADDGPLAREFA